ncbi:DNA polymerase III subunit gamma/tau [Halalkalibacterium ligniniphilum]|uniref:DNA polymerase III subunit gamma/tau n=1 Tax=Halalkalibacterium ligniniphilum TaxID=1134413 RepID=UPI00034B7D63|nr:DNA polymerase III subunit gamma/tau [Halalkalibacterium ligniniphilum]
MSYQALYRVWRPQLLKDVVGQEHITTTLQNALVQEKFSHAYLFSGPRGTGKTSAAKIIAKAINCEKAPVSEPCNECKACKGITSGAIVDVMEIDAASNNGVDEIRDIRDKVKFAPNEVRYKVYIIDEVHMLSTGAFNALLKTLEEPPGHVIFILATTEPHKIPLTIISRCQRFDFKRIPNVALVERMQEILTHENAEVDEDALILIARAAEGGMRDALSLLDQAISFAAGRVTLEDVLSITGAVSQDALLDVVEAIHNNETARALQSFDRIMSEGKDPLRFVEDLIYYYRDLLLYQTAPDAEYLLERAQVNKAFAELAKKIERSWLYKAIETLNESQQRMKWSSHPKVIVELGLVTLCNQRVPVSDAISSVDQGQIRSLSQKVEQLERIIQQLKETGLEPSGPTRETRAPVRRPVKQMPQTKVASAKVKEMLKGATKQQLQLISGRWGEVMERVRSQNIPAHAWLSDCKPVAASDRLILLAFQNEMHRDMIDTKFRPFVEGVLQETFSQPYSFFTFLQGQWDKVKEEYMKDQRGDGDAPEADPIVDEAIKLFGTDLIEIIED